MGAVYEGRHLGTARRVAVKVISTESLSKSHEVVSRFQREAMASGAIESQYIAHVLDTGIDPQTGSPYMVMELLVGEDVEQALKRIGPFSPELALRVIAQACLGLQKAHEARRRSPRHQAGEHLSRRGATAARSSRRSSTSASQR